MNHDVVSIKKYISESRNKGFYDTQIIASLKQVGWSDELIQKAFDLIDGTETPKIEKEVPDAFDKKFQNKFTFWVVVALLLSPIPFVGLAVASSTWDYIRKNKKSGGIIALLAIFINVAMILATIWILFQIFTLDPEQLTGLAKFLNDKFKFLEW